MESKQNSGGDANLSIEERLARLKQIHKKPNITRPGSGKRGIP